MIQKDKNSVTKIIDSLEKKNLVSRIVDKNDRRINIIELTEEGRNLEKIATDVAIKFMNDVVQGIDKQDLDSYMKVMRQMKNNLERE